MILHGTPESVIDQIQALETDAGMTYLMAAPLSRRHRKRPSIALCDGDWDSLQPQGGLTDRICFGDYELINLLQPILQL